MFFVALSLLLGGTGCVIPPPIDVDTSDGGSGANRPPSLVAALTTPPFGALTKRQGGSDQDNSFVISFNDPDRGDEITFRFFIDAKYTSVVQEAKQVSPGTTSPTMVTVPGLCDGVVNNVLGQHYLEVYISDRGFETSSADLRIVGAGGFRDNRAWYLQCDPQSSAP